jgi:hypothetical protein
MSVVEAPFVPVVTPAPEAGRWQRLRRLHGMMQSRARQGHLGYWRQVFEIVRLKLARGVGVEYYQMAGMWRRDMPWSDKVGHLFGAPYVRALEEMNPVPYRKLSQHKLAEKALLSMLALPTPRFLGFAHPAGGRTADGRPLATAADFERFLRDVPVDRFCAKLTEGHGGNGFVAARVERGADGILLAPMGETAMSTPSEFFAQYVETTRNGRVLEEFIDQHAVLAAFNETSVNTLRILACQPRHRTARVLGAYVRIGRAGALVDNHAAGGILAGVDLATGVVGPAFDGTPSRRTFDSHPDSGRPIAGVTLPFWQESLQLVKDALTVFPGMRFAGVDIAITPRGPVIVETNNYPGLDGVASTNVHIAEAMRQ